MLVRRCSRPRYPLDDSWLFADPMTIALEDRIIAGCSADDGAAAADAVATPLDITVTSTAELAPFTPNGLLRGDLRFTFGPWAKGICLPQRDRWVAIVAAAILTVAVVLSYWSALTKIELQVESNGPALAKMRCGDVAERASASRTL
ncbi:MAG: hypothetical protein ACI8W7_004538 [Gammaproteobacteria bacterium]|jgi:hypothetical protein